MTRIRSIDLLAVLLGVLMTLTVGLTGCSKAPTPESASPELSTEGPQLTHTVREGESLSRIADLYYGDPGRATKIAVDNGQEDPSRLAAGSVLELRFDEDEYEFAQRRGVALRPYNLGVEALAAGNLDEAERQFRLAARTAPDLPDARYNLALVLLKRGQAEQATALRIHKQEVH